MWAERDLQQASFRGVEFDFVDIEDGLKKTIAKFDYPYADGSDLEDMGLEARSVRLKAIFFGDKYKNLEDFIEALKEQGFGYLNHPVFGSIKAIPETVSIRHDERAYHAEADITFLEHLELAVSRVAAYVDTGGVAEEAAIAAGEAEANLADTLSEAGIPDNIPTAGLGTSGYMATMAGYAGSVRSAMSTVSSVVGTVQGYINSATVPFKLITSAVNYATSLPGEILGSIAGAIESVAGAYQSLINAPGKFVDSLNHGLNKVETALGDFEGDSKPSSEAARIALALKASWHVSKASALSVAAVIELAADEAAEKGESLSLKKYGMESTSARGATAGQGTTARTQIMTITEVDAVAAIARESVKAAIEAVRAAYGTSGYGLELSLKKQALIVQQAADVVRLKRERITDYEVPSDMPLHILAFNLYGDIKEADRLLRINNIKNPNFLKAGETLRVYA